VVTIEDFVLNSSTDLLSTATRTCSLERGLNGGFLALEVVAAGQPFQIGEFVARLLCQSFATRSLLTCGAKLMKAEAPPCNRRHVFHGFGRQRRGMPVAALRQLDQINHVDAVHRTGCKTQFAARAVLRKHCMHALRGADYGINRTSLYAQHATNAARLVNQRGGARNFRAVRGIEWFFQPAEQGGQLANAL